MATAAAAFQRTPTFRPPNRLSPKSSSSAVASASLQPSRRSRPTQLSLKSSSSPSSSSCSPKLFRAPIHFLVCSASSHDETLVTDDEKDVQSQPQEDPEDVDSVVDGVEESPPILSLLQSYKEALADNNKSKIAEIETHFKSIEDEKFDLERKLIVLSEELSNAKDRILRISADFDNFRKRTERERLSLVRNAQGEVIENLLPVLDNFERAKAQIKVETEKEEKISNSYQSIYKQFVEILGSLDVVPVETIGKPFDPMLHEAIMREDSSEYDEDVIIEEYRKGFRVGDRLLRPSMVKVSAGPGPQNSQPGEEDGTTADISALAEPSEEQEDGEDHSEPAPTVEE